MFEKKTYAAAIIVAFLIIVAFFSLGGGVGKIFSSSSINNSTDWEKLEAEDEQLHEEWASENADSDILYKFVHCEGDSNTYPEGTKCNDDEDDNEEENDKEEDKED